MIHHWLSVPQQVKRGTVRFSSTIGKAVQDRSHKFYIHLSSRIKQVLHFVQKIDIFSKTGLVNGRHEAALLVFIPACTLGVAYVASLKAGVAYQSDCNSLSNFVRTLILQPRKPSTCLEVPFLSDIPMLVLSFTCPFAFVAYRLLRRRLALLPSALAQTSLLQEADLQLKASQAIERLERSIDQTTLRRVSLYAASIGITVWLYSRDLTEGHLFDLLAGARSNETINASVLRAGWWANYHHHPLLVIMIVIIGSVGVYYAVQTGLLFLRIGVALIATRTSTFQNLEFDYVPTWRDRSYGWSPFTGALFLIYLATINFALSMAAIYEIVENNIWTLVVEVFFITLGIVSDVAIILGSFARMLAAHKGVELRQRQKLIDATNSGLTYPNLMEYLITANDLSSWRRIPVSNFYLSLLKVLPGIYAFAQFIETLFAKHP